MMKKEQVIIMVLFCMYFLTACGEKESVKNLEYSQENTEPIMFDTYCPYDEEYLKTLRNTYDLDGLTANCKSEFEKVQTIAKWVTNLWDHNGINVPPKNDPLSILHDVTEEGAQYRCVEYSEVIFGCLNALDIPTRTIGLKTEDVETREFGAGHVAVEAYLKDYEKWVFIDGQWGVIPVMGDFPLNAVELRDVLWNTQESDKTVKYMNFHEGVSDGYEKWIREYLYFMDVDCYKRTENGLQKYSMMLLPIGAKKPTVFQIKYPLDVDEYTQDIDRFYTLPRN